MHPAVVVSNDIGNRNSPVVIVACVTSKPSRHPYLWDVALPANDPLPKPGRVMCNQLVTIDKVRLRDFQGRLRTEQIAALDLALAVSFGIST